MSKYSKNISGTVDDRVCSAIYKVQTPIKHQPADDGSQTNRTQPAKLMPQAGKALSFWVFKTYGKTEGKCNLSTRNSWGLIVPFLKLTAKAPKKDGFQVRNLQTSRGLFSGAMLVSGRVNITIFFASLSLDGSSFFFQLTSNIFFPSYRTWVFVEPRKGWKLSGDPWIQGIRRRRLWAPEFSKKAPRYHHWWWQIYIYIYI